MPQAPKKTTPENVKTPEVKQDVPVPEPVKTTEPVKKARAAKAKPVEETPSVVVKDISTDNNDEVVSAAPTDDKTAESSIENVVQTLADKIGNLAGLIKDIQSSLKPVLKEHDKLRKIVERIQKKRDNARKSPSGFAKPNKISDELCDFIGVPHGTEKSRTDITRYINAYVKEHNLNKPTNRRIILPDEKLKKILKINNDEDVTFFVLQRLISHHFPAAGAKTAPVVSSA
jgi:chromatin remodeling complex protein RSC6